MPNTLRMHPRKCGGEEEGGEEEGGEEERSSSPTKLIGTVRGLWVVLQVSVKCV